MNNSKIVSTKTTSAIFLAIVLVTGTIAALSSPSSSFMTANAQGEPYYGMDSYDDKKSYGMDDSYGATDYRDDKKKYDSYGYSDYAMDKDRKSYDNSYKSQYQSYKPDYKPKYTSYEKDNRDKSTKDSSKSVDIKKIKCINTNLNINGNNTGDVNLGNKGQGYLGTYSSNGGEGYGKQDKGFDDCIINNNNNNTNVVAGAGGGNVTDQCAIDVEACFEQFLNSTNFALLTEALEDGITIQIGENPPVTLNSFADICEALEGLTILNLLTAVSRILTAAGVSVDSGVITPIGECIAEVLGIPVSHG